VVPLLQAEIDEMSGILQCEEADYVTAYSYFLEVSLKYFFCLIYFFFLNWCAIVQIFTLVTLLPVTLLSDLITLL
jgi:type IV secretory pathway component VirB8